MKSFLPFILLFLVSCNGLKEQKPVSYTAGFKTIHTVDASRIYKSTKDTTDYLYHRPLDIDIWYPADSSATDTLLHVRDLLSLFEQRANYYTASTIGNGLAANYAQLFSEGLKCSDSARLLSFKTNSFKNAAAVNGKFPLVIYMTAFNGMSYENYSLFEALAKKGFVVAAISSIGRFPGDMTMKRQDLMEQVNDAVITINTLKQNANIDFDKIGIVGYSWGGLAGAILAGKIPGASCLVSMEGSENHHYGEAKDENADFDTIRNSADFKDLRLTIPYLRMESAPVPAAQAEKYDSVNSFAAQHTSNSQIFSIDSANHGDFCCLSMVVPQSGNCVVNQRYKTILKLTVSFLEDHLRQEANFSKTVDGEVGKTVKKVI